MEKQTFTMLLILSLFGYSLSAQKIMTGLVTDSQNTPLIGVNIISKNTNKGFVTDVNGAFSFAVNKDIDTLIFSYVGFQSQEISIVGQSTIDVILLEEFGILDEVIVVGYGNLKKSDLTGAITKVKGEDIERIPTNTAVNALQGKIAGVQIVQSSGEPGAGSVVRIRGVGTLNNSSPVYVVDGLFLDDIGHINTADIESIEVLKDASAQAIYGSRGANGVIIVTTKQGESGKTSVRFNNYVGWQKVVNTIEMSNAQEYATLVNEAFGNTFFFPNPEELGEGTVWWEEVFRKGMIRDHQLSVSGGTDKVKYFVSGGWFNQEGVVNKSEYDRLTFRANNKYIISDHISIGHNVSFLNSKEQNISSTKEYDEFTNNGIIRGAYTNDPTIGPLDSLGEFSFSTVSANVGNPVASLFYTDGEREEYRMTGNAYAELTFLRGFTFKSSYGFNLRHDQAKRFTPEFFVSAIQQNENSRIKISREKEEEWVWENTLAYDKEWTKHRLNVVAGITAQEFVAEWIGGSREDLISEGEDFNFLDAGNSASATNFNGGTSRALYSYLFRANYVFQDKYLLTTTFRRDGSSRFGKLNRFGNFPAVALGWRVTQEPFMEGVGIVSNLKIRGSWGIIGNEKAFRDNPAIPVITGNRNAVFGEEEALYGGAIATQLANPALRWEETRQMNIGFDLSLFENKFFMEADWYERKTEDILIDVEIPQFVGADAPIINAASVVNNGVDLALGWRENLGAFNYKISINGSIVNNEVLRLGKGKENILGGGFHGGILVTRTEVGQPIGSFYGYEVVGVFQNQEEIDAGATLGQEKPGDFIFKDQNGDGMITPEEDRVYIGSPIPDFIYGASVSLSYKGLDLAIDLQGQEGNEIFNAKRGIRFGLWNWEKEIFDTRWNGEGTSNTAPRVTFGGGHNNESSDYFIEDGSYFKIKNIQLGYSLPKAWTAKMKMEQFRIYLNASNAFTFTQYNGFSPEVIDGSVVNTGIDRLGYPIPAIYTFGINTTF